MGAVNFSHQLITQMAAYGDVGDTMTANATQGYMDLLNTPDVSTGQIIAGAGEFKMGLSAVKTVFDVINTLADDNKRMMEGAIR